VLGAELLVDAHELAALIDAEQRADREHRAQALLLQLGLRAPDRVGLLHHRVGVGGVGREQRVHLVVQAAQGVALRLRLRGAGFGERADLVARRVVEVQALGVALEDAFDAGRSASRARRGGGLCKRPLRRTAPARLPPSRVHFTARPPRPSSSRSSIAW
jgi:hypothetical protein